MKYILAFSLLFVATFTIAQTQPQASIVVSSLSQLTGYSGSLLQANWSDANRGGKLDLVDAAGLTIDNGIVFASGKAGKVWKRDISQATAVNVKWFGAVGDSSTDETTAFLAAAATRLPMFIPEGNYIIRKPITIYNDVRGESRAAAILWKDSVTLFQFAANDISVNNLTAIADTITIRTSSPRFINSNSYNNVQLNNDSIVNARLILSSNQLTGSRGISVINCVLLANFNSYTIETAQHDLITIQGYKGVLFDKNRITALNMHRVWKISAALVPGIPNAPSDEDSLGAFAAEEIMIRNNVIFSSSRVRFQFMDLYAGTVDFTFKDNWVEAYGHAALIQSKNTQQNSAPFNTKIVGNYFKWAGTDDVAHPRSGLAVQGVYGKVGQVDSLYFDNVDISGNTFEDTNSISKSYAVEVRFYHSARVYHNDFLNSGHGKINPFIRIGACQSYVVANNTLQTGHIELLNYVSNLNGDSFHVARIDGKVTGNFIADFSGFSAGIYVSRVISPTGTIEISHNTIRQIWDDTSSLAAIYLSNDTLGIISLVGNTASLADATKNKIRLANNQFGAYIESINSWQGSAIANRGQAIGENLSLGTLDSFNISIMTDNHKRINFTPNGKIQIGETVIDSSAIVNIQGNSSATTPATSTMGIHFRNTNSTTGLILGELVFSGSVDTAKIWDGASISVPKAGSGAGGLYADITFNTKPLITDAVLTEAMRISHTGSVGINNASPDAKAILDMVSTTKGVLLPRMTRPQFTSISSKPTGLIAFGTTLNKFVYYDGTTNRVVLDSATADARYALSGSGGASVPAAATVTSNVTNSTTTVADVTGIAFTVAANKKYSFSMDILTACDNTGGIKFKFTAPSSTTVAISFAGNSTSVSTPQFSSLKDLTIIPSGFNRFAGDGGVHIEGHISTTNSGTVQLQFAANSAAQTATIYSGSMGHIMEIQ